MNKFNLIFQDVLKQIKPTDTEFALINKVTGTIRELISERAKDLNIEYTTIEAQGSTGIKQTQLKNDFDIDLFVGLNYEKYKPKKENLSKNKLKQHLKSLFKKLCTNWIIPAISIDNIKNPRLFYAEHPYVKAKYVDPREDQDHLKLDIVLYFDLEEDYIKHNGPITAVDRSPWHGRFVKNNLDDTQKDDVRLLKQFFKACHSYGDKSAVGRVGFIGYSAELLIYHYGDILNTFHHFEDLKTNALDYFGRSTSKLEKLKRFQNDFLIIIDPVDMNRNVASAISERAYRYCNHQISSFLKNPQKSFFQIDPIPKISNIPENLQHLFIVELLNTDKTSHYTENRDKLYSLGDYIQNIGEREFTHEKRFGTIKYELYFELETDNYSLAFYCEDPQISKRYTRKGPPIDQGHHAKKFKEKNNHIFEKDGHLWTTTKRDYFQFLTFLKDYIPQKLPDNMKIRNIAKASQSQTITGKRALYVLKKKVLPFEEK